SKTAITDTGATMILRKILLDLEEELILFRGEINKPGFIQQLLSLYQEMQTSNIATEDLHLGGTMNRSNGEDALKFSE
ncbi:hypothetical protein, partial [Enterococcus faecalis]